MKSSGGFTAEQFSARYKKLSKEEKKDLRKLMQDKGYSAFIVYQWTRRKRIPEYGLQLLREALKKVNPALA